MDIEKTEAIYHDLIENTPDVEVKGAKNKYTSVNGNMFSFLTKEGKIALRLADEDRAAFLKKYPNSVCVQHDTVMKHYVEVPDSILKSKSRLTKLFAQCCEHSFALKPKPTTRKKK